MLDSSTDSAHQIRRINDSYDSWGLAQRPSYGRYYGNRNNNEFPFSSQRDMENDSGFCSPPLWKTSPPTSPNRDRSLSPAARTQAIARGRRELMDMIRNMPESCYELSLKDLVERSGLEHRTDIISQEQRLSNETITEKSSKNHKQKQKKKKKKKNDHKQARMMRSGSMDNGNFLLKMVFPISIGFNNKKKKKNSATSNPGSKVSPKPNPNPNPVSESQEKGVDKEWWRKRFAVSGESENGGASSSSGSIRSNGSSRSSSCRRPEGGGSFPNCCSFFTTTKKSKTPE